MVLLAIAVMKTGMAMEISLCERPILIVASDDEEDETAELMRELEKIKKERAEQREREVDCPSRLGSGESDG